MNPSIVLFRFGQLAKARLASVPGPHSGRFFFPIGREFAFAFRINDNLFVKFFHSPTFVSFSTRINVWMLESTRVE
jgi:hypothetical protein